MHQVNKGPTVSSRQVVVLQPAAHGVGAVVVAAAALALAAVQALQTTGELHPCKCPVIVAQVVLSCAIPEALLAT